MRAAILTIGDELLVGQVLNSNVQWMSDQLAQVGATARTHLTVGDEVPVIRDAVRTLAFEHDIILVGGGLGPTHDDVTVEAIAGVLGRSLRFDEEWYHQVRIFFEKRGRSMPLNNQKQCWIPEGAERLDNEVGTAPGLWIEWENRVIAVFPGVPHEMKFLFQKYFLPRLAARSSGSRVLQRTFLTTGVGESALADRLQSVQPLLKKDLKLAFLPSLYGVRLRVTAYAQWDTEKRLREEMQALTDQLVPLLGKDFYGEGDQSLEAVVGDQLLALGQTLAVAESCTGGMVLHRLTQVAGSSRYVLGGVVAYQNEVKVRELGVEAEIIAQQTAVCESVARQMAQGVRKRYGASIGLATTGILGPGGGSKDQPVGLVYLGISSEKGTDFRKLIFENDRIRNKERATQSALDFLRRSLIS